MTSATDLAFMAVRRYKTWARKFRREIVDHQGLTLPASHLRLCGEEFHDNAYFLASARNEAERLMSHCGLQTDSRLLDVGCGMGRLPLGILSHMGEIRAYRGIDVQSDCISWCAKHITSKYPAFQFMHVNARNERYNPNGKDILDDFSLPFETESFDVINMFSVFTHLTESDIGVYLRELHRVLSPKGRIFLTAYVEDDVPDVTENPKGYLLRSIGPLHIMRYNRAYFDTILSHYCWKIDHFDHRAEPPGQSAYYLSKS